uniref:Uncharacterized protein n=1 Tax=Arundo donax TaxID=35708 RepID=A0A0A9CGE5_ARUDO
MSDSGNTGSLWGTPSARLHDSPLTTKHCDYRTLTFGNNKR